MKTIDKLTTLTHAYLNKNEAHVTFDKIIPFTNRTMRLLSISSNATYKIHTKQNNFKNELNLKLSTKTTKAV